MLTRGFFVYGTLKRGQANAALLIPRAESIEDGTITGSLYDLGEFPALLEGDGAVHGELVTVSEEDLPRVLRTLDALEGHFPENPSESMYVRKVVDVSTRRGTVQAHAYFYNSGHAALPAVEDLRLLADGSWTGPTQAPDGSRDFQRFLTHVRRFPTDPSPFE